MPIQSKSHKCPFITKQYGKILHCIKEAGHKGAHQHRGESEWYKPLSAPKK